MPGLYPLNDLNAQVKLMRRVGRLVLADPQTKRILSQRVVDWALAEFGGYAAMLSAEEILDAARAGIGRRLSEREEEISCQLAGKQESNVWLAIGGGRGGSSIFFIVSHAVQDHPLLGSCLSPLLAATSLERRRHQSQRRTQ